mmetsp:Transcript_19435/g.58689  ORF Transcript_19435/g.58689 Transcript_19435/m.58689 type:complete len:255 (+) Transcript_19435:1193-1957(+)
MRAATFVFSGRMEFGACGTAPQSGVCEPSLDASGRIASGYSCLGGVKATPAPKAPTAKPRPPFPSTSKPGRETSTTAIVAAAAPALEPFRPRPRLCEPPPAGRVGTSGKISAASHKTAGGRLCLRPPPPPPPLSASPRSKAAASLRATEAAGDKLGARLVREEAEHAASAAADRGRAPDGPAGLTTTFEGSLSCPFSRSSCANDVNSVSQCCRCAKMERWLSVAIASFCSSISNSSRCNFLDLWSRSSSGSWPL